MEHLNWKGGIMKITANERRILDFLWTCKSFISSSEIGYHVGDLDESVITNCLGLVEQGLLEKNGIGWFRPTTRHPSLDEER